MKQKHGHGKLLFQKKRLQKMDIEILKFQQEILTAYSERIDG